MQHTEASLTLHKHGRFIEMIILYYRTNSGTKIGKTIYLIRYIIAIIALTSRHLDPILHYTYDRTCSNASMFYHLPYARYAPSSCYHTDSIPAYLSTSQPLTHIYDCDNFDLFRSLHHLQCLSAFCYKGLLSLRLLLLMHGHP